MTGRTHLLIGALTGIAIAKSMSADPGIIAVATASAGVGALLPDIDTPKSIISQLIFPLRMLFAFFKVAHRGLTHSIPALIFIAWFCYMVYLDRPDFQIYLITFITGYASHMIADMLTPAGVSIFYPIPVKLKLMPAIISRITTPVLDRFIFFACIVGIFFIVFGVDATPLLADINRAIIAEMTNFLRQIRAVFFV